MEKEKKFMVVISTACNDNLEIVDYGLSFKQANKIADKIGNKIGVERIYIIPHGAFKIHTFL